MSVSFRGRKGAGRKLSLVQELAQNYGFDDNELDGGDSISETEVDMMVIPKGRIKSAVRGNALVGTDALDSGTDVLSSLSEMKSEVRREIEVMNMKMTQLEEQISTILSILKSQGHLHSRAYGSLSGSIDKGRVSSTSYLNDTTPPEESQDRSKIREEVNNNLGDTNEEEPLPEWLAVTASPVCSLNRARDWSETSNRAPDQEHNASQAARLLNDREGQTTTDPDPRILQTLHFMKNSKK